MSFLNNFLPKNIEELFEKYIKSESTSAVLLLIVTVVSAILANSPLREAYLGFWHTKVSIPFELVDLNLSVRHWVNDAIMVLFFLMVGLEVERSIYIGELSDFKSATLPIVAAVGGLLTPALIYLFFNFGEPTEAGFGIPMATDIAFSIGILALLGSRVPFALKIFLTAVAVVDDVGAIIIILIFYSQSLNYLYLFVSGLLLLVLWMMNYVKVEKLTLYLIPGVFLWYFVYKAGIHPTIAGVVLAFLIPFGDGSDSNSPSFQLLNLLNYPVAYFVMPLFALANATILFESDWFASLGQASSLGTIFGLILGKPIGILGMSLLAIWIGVAKLPKGVTPKMILGVGMISGIGFTMSIFITNLAFTEEALVNDTKIAIIIASIISGLLGYGWLSFLFKRKDARASDAD